MQAQTTQPEAPAAPPAINERLARQVEELVLKRIGSDTLVLPTIPAVALKCLEVLRKPDFSFKEAAAVLEQDPVLTARVIRLATSAAFGAFGKSPGLSAALSRLGAKRVKSMMIEASASTVFVSRNARIAEAARRVWAHSVAVALLARDVSALTGSADSEGAYLAGLLHDIGKPIVAAILLEAERQIAELRNKPWIEGAEWTAVVGRTHRAVGVALNEKWEMPAEVTRCVKECSEFDPSNRTSIVNAVCFSNALAKANGFGVDDSGVDDAKALVMIGRSMLGIDNAVLIPLVAGLKPRLQAIYE